MQSVYFHYNVQEQILKFTETVLQIRRKMSSSYYSSEPQITEPPLSEFQLIVSHFRGGLRQDRHGDRLRHRGARPWGEQEGQWLSKKWERQLPHEPLGWHVSVRADGRGGPPVTEHEGPPSVYPRGDQMREHRPVQFPYKMMMTIAAQWSLFNM